MSRRPSIVAVAFLLNTLVPGAGLILVGGVRLGLALAMLYGLCGHAAIAAWLIAPTAWPRGVSWAILAGLAAVWAAGQYLLRATLTANDATPDRAD